MRISLIGLMLLIFSTAVAGPAGVPAALYTDRPADKDIPASLEVLHIPSHGVELYGTAYTPGGRGPHPILLICHGMPGLEKNLDLAHAARRAGWVAVYFDYRGSWGTGGPYSLAGGLDDTAAALAYLRDPAHAAALHADPSRIVLAGHSYGGAVVAVTAARDHALSGIVMISAGDMGSIAAWPYDKRLALARTAVDGLANMTPELLAEDLGRQGELFSFKAAAPRLVDVPLLALTSNDGFAFFTDALVKDIRAAGGKQVTTRYVPTDHSWSDQRVLLLSTIINWLDKRR